MSARFSDVDLVEEVLAGSRVAFAWLMKRHERAVYRVAWSYTRDDEASLDLCQEVFLKVHRHLGRFRGDGPFAAWLLRIAHREGLNWIERHRKRKGEEPLTELNAPAAVATQEGQLLQKQQRALLMRELDRLSTRQRQALMLRHLEGRPLREVAAVLDCSEGVAKIILFRGLDKLRRRLPFIRRWNDGELHTLPTLDRSVRR